VPQGWDLIAAPQAGFNIVNAETELERLLQTYRGMLGSAEADEDQERMALCHNYIGSTLRLMGRWGESRGEQMIALQIARNLSSKIPLSAALSNLGALGADNGKYDEALGYLAESLELAEQEGNPLRAASALGNIGKVQLARGNWNLALGNFQFALAKSSDQNDPRHTMCSYTSLALLECSRGDFRAAEEYLAKADVVAQSISVEIEEGIDEGRTLPDGSFSFEERLKRRRDLFVFQLAKAQIARCNQDISGALTAITEALAVAARVNYAYGLVRAHIEKAWILLSAAELPLANSSAGEAVEGAKRLGARQLEGEALHVLGVIQRTQGSTEALDTLGRAIRVLKGVGDVHNSGRVAIDLGVTYISHGEEAEASVNLLRGLQQLISLGKTAENVETVDLIGEAVQMAARHLEEATSVLLENVVATQRDSKQTFAENELVDLLERQTRLEADFASLFAVGRVLLQCAHFLSRLAPTSQAQDRVRVPIQSLSALLEILRDQQGVVTGETDSVRHRLGAFERDRAARTNLFLQGIQSTLSGVGAAAIYTALLLQGRSDVTENDLIFVALAVIGWAGFPIIVLQWRFKTASFTLRVLLSLIVVTAIVVSAQHIVEG
jgi:tetratricopeptide (TPR) repeat protein